MVNCGIFKSNETDTDEGKSDESQWSSSSRVVLETEKKAVINVRSVQLWCFFIFSHDAICMSQT